MRCVIYLRVSTRGQAEKGEGEEGFSIPAQREACARHIRDAGWDLVDEYADRGESARSAERPQLQAMLTRIAEERDVDAVVVHKIDRLARNMEDHVAIRALLRRRDVALVSVTENVEETASGRLVEGIHALMAEFYSANLAAEIKKGMVQKAKLGGFPHGAPIGYLNVKDLVAGRQVARIVPDPERASLVTVAFEHYATGEWTLQRLAGELGHRGLTNRGRRDRPVKPITWQGLAKILANPVYVGIVCWGGVEHPGLHEPLTTPEVFRRVQELLAARSVRGTRERKHPHYLKGLLHCGVCGRRLSIQHSKGRYTYFFCLGQKNDPAGTCRERYIAADDLEAQVEQIYTAIQLPASWAERLREELDAEVIARQRADAAQRELLTRRVAKAETERRKLLDAYYSGAIDVPTLKVEQARIGADLTAAHDRLADLDANLTEWQEILELAATFATRCGDAYRKATDRTRKQFNAAVFERLDVKDGRICHEEYRPPFDDIFNVPEFEYGTRERATGIEPAFSAWEADVLPLNYARTPPERGRSATSRPLDTDVVDPHYRLARMVLSDHSIREALDAGRIVIDPLGEGSIQPSSVDLHVDRYFRLFRNHTSRVIDVREDQEDLTELVEMGEDVPLILHPGEFLLGSTLEKVTLPADLVARLEGKSSLGRLGLLIHSTAGFVDAGWDGHLTLELSNVANLPITVYPGMKIGQISFLEMTTPADHPYGSAGLRSKYQGQWGPTPSRYADNFRS